MLKWNVLPMVLVLGILLGVMHLWQGLAYAVGEINTYISGGSSYTVVLKSDGTVWAWGYNDYGQLGDGTITRRTTPVKVQGLTGITAIASRHIHTTALKSDGTVWTWGCNAHGQLGDGTVTHSNTPVQVQGLNGVIAIESGHLHTVALKSDGTVWAWGYNGYGQLGDGTTVDKVTPVQVQGLTGITAIAGGAYHTLALKNDGTVWSWGYNAFAQLGDGTTIDRSIPIQVSGLTGVTIIAGGYGCSMALKNNGTVWAWGWNTYGQLGDGTRTDRCTPVQVQDLSNIVAITGGQDCNIALKNDGTVWTWGGNCYGQLGHGTTVNKNTPVQVQGLSGVTAVAGGYLHSIALKSDGTVWTWGYNNCGQLGDGTTTNRYTPVQVQGLTGVGLNSPSSTSTPTPTPQPTPTPANVMIIPTLITDMEKYIRNDTVYLSLKLTNTQSNDKTNSVTFQIDYDGDTFEPLTGNLDNDIVNNYLPSNVKLDLGLGSNKSLHVSYVDMNTDVDLQEGAKVFTAKFKVKKTAISGKKTFALKPVTMLDSSNNAYKVKDADPITVDIMGDAAIEGYMNIYLGDSGTDLNTSILDKLNQTQINDTLKNLKFTLKLNQSDSGTVLNGSDVFIPDENGNLAVKGTDDKVKGRFRVFTSDPANAILTLSGVGYLKKSITLPALNLSKLSAINAPYSATEVYPGDIGQIVDYTLVLSPDDKITNADFSGWLKTYKDNMGDVATTENIINADFTKDKEIDNVDFSLWLATFKRILTGVQ